MSVVNTVPATAASVQIAPFCDNPNCSLHLPNPNNYNWATVGKLTLDRAYIDGRHLCLLCQYERNDS